MSDNENIQLYDPELLKYQESLFEFVLEISRLKRTNSKIAKITAFLLFYDSLTQTQIQELTKFSRGSISTYLTILSDVGFIKKERITGSHTYKYLINIELEDYIKSGLSIFSSSLAITKPTLYEKEKKLGNLAQKNEKGAEFLQNRANSIIKTLDIYDRIFTPLIKQLENQTKT